MIHSVAPFSVGQIVKGHVAGTFRVLGFRDDLGSELVAMLREVNPANHADEAPGQIGLEVSLIRPLN